MINKRFNFLKFFIFVVVILRIITFLLEPKTQLSTPPIYLTCNAITTLMYSGGKFM